MVFTLHSTWVPLEEKNDMSFKKAKHDIIIALGNKKALEMLGSKLFIFTKHGIIYFLFSFYSLSFWALFLYREIFFILFGNKLWMRNFLFCIKQILGIWFLYLLVKVLLVVVGYIRSKLILMGLLSDTKLGWLQKDTLNSMVWIIRRHLPLLQKWLFFILLLS